MVQAAEPHTAAWRLKAIARAFVNRLKIKTLIERPGFAPLQHYLQLSAGYEEGHVPLCMFDISAAECFSDPSAFLIKENQ